jgi:hypothetical protein
VQKLQQNGCIVKQHFLWGDEEVINDHINQKSREQQIQFIVEKL